MHENKIFIPNTLTDRILSYAHDSEVPVEKIWLVTFQAFLHRITQESPVVVAAAIETNKRWNIFSTEFNQPVPFSELLKNHLTTRAEGISTAVIFQYENGVTAQPPENLNPILHLEINDSATVWRFDTAHYSTDEIKHIPQIFIHFAENLSQNFNQPYDQVSLLAPEQWAEMESWNNTESDFPAEASLHGLISAQANKAPERIAVVYNGVRLSYGEMEKRANRLAHALITAGVQPGDVIGLYIDRNLDLIIAQLAILKTGAAYAALDLQYPREMLAHLFNNFNLPYILTHSNLKSLLPPHTSGVFLIDEFLEQKNHPATAPEIVVDARAAAFIIFTSGSTGIPKGVIHTHRNMIARFHSAWALAAMNAEDVISQTSPLSSIDAVDEIYSPFLLGAQTVMIPHKIVTDPRRLVDLLEEEGVTRMVLVPSLLQIILTTYADIDRRLARLKTWLIGGEALTATLVKQFYERLPQANLINFYGLTEGDATFYPAVISEMPPPVGRPIQNTRVYVLDSQLQPMPPGLSGEIFISGEGLFREYWNRPDLNTEKWMVNPFNTSQNDSFSRLFKTGDLGRWQPDGQLQYLGRRDRMVKIRSFRVELGEVEAALAVNPLIRECAVRVWQTESANHAVTYQPRIVAYAVLKESAQTTPAQIRDSLKERLPDYALPKQVTLLNSLPYLPNGKIDYRALPEPSESETPMAENFCAPTDEFELYLVKLWERLLNRRPIGTQDNFFDLGGDSLLVILMITELEKELGQTLSLALLFHTPTIAQLAPALKEKGWKPAWSSLVPIQPHGSKPPLFCVHADGGAFFYNRFTSHISPQQPLYGIQARGLDGKESPFTNIKEMAQQYIKEIRSVQPKGPYIISGFSMGGVVVYEIAQQLLHDHEEPSLVIFLDAPSPTYPEMLPKHNKGFLSKLKNFFDLPANKKIEHIAIRSSKRWNELQDETLSRLYLLFKQPLPPALRIHVVRKTNQRISDLYQPQPYAGDVTVLRASEQMPGAKPDRTLGWGQYVIGSVNDFVIPGDHESVFQEPNVGLLARQLQLSIDHWLEKQQKT